VSAAEASTEGARRSGPDVVAVGGTVASRHFLARLAGPLAPQWRPLGEILGKTPERVVRTREATVLVCVNLASLGISKAGQDGSSKVTR